MWAGAVAQIPIVYTSDRMDRRKVLVATAALALLADLAFVVFVPEGRMMNLVLVAVFGAAIFAMYPILVAHANDHAPAGSSIQVSGGLLMVFGLGSIVGPLVAGLLMSEIGPRGLFGTTIFAHVAIIAFTLWRIWRVPAVPQEKKGAFHPIPPARTTTPETTALAEGVSGDGKPLVTPGAKGASGPGERG